MDHSKFIPDFETGYDILKSDIIKHLERYAALGSISHGYTIRTTKYLEIPGRKKHRLKGRGVAVWRFAMVPDPTIYRVGDDLIVMHEETYAKLGGEIRKVCEELERTGFISGKAA